MLTSIEIKNFRGIRAMAETKLKRLNVFLGPNNCGKTSVLESLFLLIGMSNPDLLFKIHSFRDLILTDENDLSYIFHNLDLQTLPFIRAKSNTGHADRSLEIKPISSTSASYVKEKSMVQRVVPSSSAESALSGLDFAFRTVTKGRTDNQHSFVHHVGEGRFNLQINKSYRENILGIFVNSRSVSVSFYDRLEKLIVEKKKQLLIPIFQTVDSRIQDLSLGRNGMVFIDVGASKLLPINVIGDGIRKVGSILSALFSINDGILLVDEIENGLHFETLKVLWKAVLANLADSKNQLFVATHSMECLLALKEAMETDERKTVRSEFAAFSMNLDSQNTLKMYEYDFDKFAFSITNSIEIRGGEF